MERDDTSAAHDEQRAGRYQIRVRGHLAPRWEARFEGLALTREDEGTTLLEGLLPDQSALHRVLRQIRDLGLDLISVVRGPPPG